MIDTKRGLNRTESLIPDFKSSSLKTNRLQLSLLDEGDEGEIDELHDYNQDQKLDVERRFKHINANNIVTNQKVVGAKTGKNLFNKLKNFFV